MTGSIWAPGSTPEVNADATLVTERFVAAAAQTSFTLTNFTYVLGTDSLLIFKNGELLAPGIDVFESTTSTFVLAAGAAVNDVILAVGFIGITGTVTVNTVDIFVANIAAMRAYVGANNMLYLQNTVAPPDGTEGMFQLFTGAAPATYVDDGVNVIVPSGGDGSAAWLRATEAVRRSAIELDTVSQVEAEARVATTTRTWTAERVGQAIAAGITAIVTGSFIAGLYEALANTNKYTDAEKTKLAGLVIPGQVTGHIKAGRKQIVDGEIATASYAISTNVAQSVWETVGGIGSGKDNEWADMDKLPPEATILLARIDLLVDPNTTGQGIITFYACSGDVAVPTPVESSRLARIGFDPNSASSRCNLSFDIEIPLGPTDQDFKCTWVVTGSVAYSADLIYRGFIAG